MVMGMVVLKIMTTMEVAMLVMKVMIKDLVVMEAVAAAVVVMMMVMKIILYGGGNGDGEDSNGYVSDYDNGGGM